MQGRPIDATPTRPEMDHRRSGFGGDAPIRLADGQDWFFPGPDAGHANDPGFRERSQALLAEIGEAEDEADRCRAELALMIYLLSLNYALDPADYLRLLGEAGDEAASRRMRAAFRDLAARFDRANRPGGPPPGGDRRPLPPRDTATSEARARIG